MIHRRKVLSCCLTTILSFSILTGIGFASPAISALAAAGQSTANNSLQKRGSDSSGLTSSEIASAKAKGLVWVNTKSRTYHTGGRYYGKTKHGRFMSLDDAKKAGYRASKH